VINRFFVNGNNKVIQKLNFSNDTPRNFTTLIPAGLDPLVGKYKGSSETDKGMN